MPLADQHWLIMLENRLSKINHLIIIRGVADHWLPPGDIKWWSAYSALVNGNMTKQHISTLIMNVHFSCREILKTPGTCSLICINFTDRITGHATYRASLHRPHLSMRCKRTPPGLSPAWSATLASIMGLTCSASGCTLSWNICCYVEGGKITFTKENTFLASMMWSYAKLEKNDTWASRIKLRKWFISLFSIRRTLHCDTSLGVSYVGVRHG